MLNRSRVSPTPKSLLLTQKNYLEYTLILRDIFEVISDDYWRSSVQMPLDCQLADDTAKFSNVQFWGDDQGEFLVAGGKIRYADVAIDSVSAVPEPLTIVGTMLRGAAALRMKKRLKATNKL